MKFFTYDKANDDVSINDVAVLLIKEFADLFKEERNKSKTDKTGKNKERAYKELKFIYLFFDGSSPYFSFIESERYNESFKDSGLTEAEMEDPVFKSACKKYDSILNSLLEIRLLKAAMTAIENQIYYLENVDLNERDPATGKPIFKSKDLIAEIKGCKDLISSLRELETQVLKGEDADSGKLRGDKEAGMFD